MNITFLIGNGFDLGLGIHTSYSNFYDEYCAKTKDDNDNIKEFKAELEKWQKTDKSDKDEIGKIVNWSDFEEAFGKHSSAFTIDEKQKYIERFRDFVMKFNSYLEEQEEKLDYSNKKLIGNTMKKAITTFQEIRKDDQIKIEKIYKRYPSSTRIFTFVSFNYTNAVDNCVNCLKELLHADKMLSIRKDVLHIHGYIERNMIMGLNDPSQISNPKFASDKEITQQIVKPQQNAVAKSGYESEVLTAIRNSDIICIYGMSIGSTDKKWWKTVAKWLMNDNNRLLVILGHDNNYDQRYIFSQLDTTEKYIKAFLTHAELTNIQSEQLRDRILVGINYDIFAMKIVHEQNRIQKTQKNDALKSITQLNKDISDTNIVSEELRELTKVNELVNV